MSRKGVTPVIATALLIGITVSTVLTASVYVDNSISDVKELGDDISDEQRAEDAEMGIQYGYKRSGDLFIDIRNKGSIALPLKDNGSKVLSIYADGRPVEDWKFLSDREVLGTSGTITINTTVDFPPKGNYTKILVRGSYETESTIICYNDGSPSC